jgi:2'-5' RNA ligase
MRYLVAISLPEPWRTELSQVQDHLRTPTWRNTMDPHITLLAPDRPVTSVEQAAYDFATCALPVSAFTISAHTIGRFDRRHHSTLTLVPNEHAPLQQLFQALLLANTWQDPGTSTRRTYEPHITLANQLDPQQGDAAETYLRRLHLNVSFLCDAIQLFCKQTAWPKWQVVASRLLPQQQLDANGNHKQPK